MKLINIRAENIFSIDKLDQDLDNLGLTMVTGYSHDENSANGAGKSSFTRNALVWGLYGQTMSGVKGDDVINRHSTSKSCFVSLSFEGIDSNNYKIERQRNPNFLKLYKEGKDISSKLEKDTQENINLLLGRDFQSFIQTDFFGQGRISFLELAPADQKKVVEDILPMDKLSAWEIRAKEIKNKLKEKKSKIELNLANVEGRIAAININKLKAERTERDFIEKKENRIRNISSDIIHLKNVVIEQSLKSIMIHQKDIMKDLKKIKSFKEPRKTLLLKEQENEKLDKILRTFKSLRQKKEYQIDSIKRRIDESSVLIHNYKNRPNICPTCKSSISNDTLTILMYDEIKKKNNLENELKILQNDCTEISRNLKQETDRNQKNSDIIVNISFALKSIEHSQNMINRETKKIEEVKEKIQFFEKSLAELHEDKTSFSDLTEKYTTQLAEVSQEKKKLKTEVSITDEEIKRVEFWIKVYGKELKTLLFEEACPFLEEKTNQYLKLLNNSQIKATVSTIKTLKSGENKNEFNITVKSKTGGELFSLLSGGEQQMVNFAVGLALSDLAENQVRGASKLMILDEPFTNLDSSNCENVVSFLTTHLTKKKETILFISNEDGLQSLIPNRIHIEKRDGLSRIV